MKTIVQGLKIVLPLALGFYLAWYSISSIENKDRVIEVLGETNYFFILLSILFSWLSHMARSIRWKYLLEPLGHKTSVWSNYHAVMTGYFMNLLIPRAGEISRAGLINRLEKVPLDKALGTIIAERVVDVLMLGTISFITIALQYDMFSKWTEGLDAFKPGTEGKSSWLIYLLAGAGVLFVAFLVFYFTNEKLRMKVKSLIRGLLDGMLTIVRLKNRSAFVLYTLAIWTLYIALYIVCFYSLDETASLETKGLMLGFVGGSIGIVLVQGGIGVYPLLVAAALTLYGADRDIVIALGWIVWSAQTLLLIGAGAVSFYLVSRKMKLKE